MKLQKNCKKKRLHVARLVSCNIVSNLFFYIFGLRCQSKWEGGDKLGSSLLSGYH